jgi:hypothetical protein
MKNGMKIVLSLSLILCSLCAKGQQVAVKTNLVYDALLTVNLGVEVGLAPRWTLDVSGNYNGWTLSHDRRWKHWLVQPEARYWFCDRFAGHFLGMHLLGGQYNIGGLKNGVSFLGTDFSKLSVYSISPPTILNRFYFQLSVLDFISETFCHCTDQTGYHEISFVCVSK